MHWSSPSQPAATGGRGRLLAFRSLVAVAVLAAAGVPAVGAQVAVPANDAFGSAPLLQLPASVSGDTRGASVERSEPSPSCALPRIGRTTWYQLTPEIAGEVIATVSPLDSAFWPVLALYAGTSLNDLEEVACTDNLVLTAQLSARRTYFLQVGGPNLHPSHESGPFRLLLGPAVDLPAGSPRITPRLSREDEGRGEEEEDDRDDGDEDDQDDEDDGGRAE